MANLIYPKGKENLLAGNIDIDGGVIKAVLVDGQEYTYSAAHDALDDVPSGGRISTATCASKTITNGTFDCADITFTSVTGDQFEFVIFYQEGGSEATSYLICIFDTATGLPLTPNGANLVAEINASGVFSL